MTMTRATAAYAELERDDSALVTRYGHLIERVTTQVARKAGIPELQDELWSAGALGLLDAARRFDKTKGAKFETFALHRVRGAVLDELRRIDHLPRRLRERVDQLSRARHRLGQALGREPSADELAVDAGLTLDELATIESASQPHAPITAAAEIGADGVSPDEGLARAELSAQLAAAIAKLPGRLQLLLSLYYVEELPYRDIARLMEVSEPRVCQLHAQATAKLRELLPDGGF